MLTLVIPGLIWPRQALADLSGDLPLPALSRLLGSGRLQARPASDAMAMLAGALGAVLPLPAAALRRLASGCQADTAEWLCLDPVRLRFEERHLVLDDPRALRLDAAEAAALAVSLAPTFAALGALEQTGPQDWNLRLDVPAPAFVDMTSSIGRTAAPLPVDAAWRPWRQALNEAQMVLHGHPVNQTREAAGKPVVNSLWPWGGGRLPQRSACAQDSVWASDPVVRGLAQVQGIAAAALPRAFAMTPGKSALAWFDDLAAPARLGDAIAWREALIRLESAWLAPALDALRGGSLDALHVLAPGERNSVELVVRRSDLLKFWRKPRRLADAFATEGPA